VWRASVPSLFEHPFPLYPVSQASVSEVSADDSCDTDPEVTDMHTTGSCTIIQVPGIVTVEAVGPCRGEKSVCAHG